MLPVDRWFEFSPLIGVDQMETAGKSTRSFDLSQHPAARVSPWRILLALLTLSLSSAASYAGDLNLLINGKAFHINAPAGTQFNERNWGAGVQYDFDPIGRNKNWIPLAMASGFQDSFKNPSYYAGGGLMRRFLPFSSLNNFHVDAGVVAFFMTREDYKDNDPFFGMLPALSIGTQRVSLNLTYVPKVHPKMVQLIFIQLKVGLGKAK